MKTIRKRLYENCDETNYSYPQCLGDDQIFKSFVLWSRIVEVTSSLMAGSHQQLQLSRFPDFKFAILLKIRTDSSFARKFSHKNGAGGGLQIWTAHIKWISKMRYFEYWQRIMIIWWNEVNHSHQQRHPNTTWVQPPLPLMSAAMKPKMLLCLISTVW